MDREADRLDKALQDKATERDELIKEVESISTKVSENMLVE
jgi:hypothetical protein